MTRIVLTCPHTHAGKAFEAGARLDVDGGTADWLITHGIARHDLPSTPAPSPTDEGTPVQPKTTHRKESKS